MCVRLHSTKPSWWALAKCSGLSWACLTGHFRTWASDTHANSSYSSVLSSSVYRSCSGRNTEGCFRPSLLLWGPNFDHMLLLQGIYFVSAATLLLRQEDYCSFEIFLYSWYLTSRWGSFPSKFIRQENCQFLWTLSIFHHSSNCGACQTSRDSIREGEIALCGQEADSEAQELIKKSSLMESSSRLAERLTDTMIGGSKTVLRIWTVSEPELEVCLRQGVWHHDQHFTANIWFFERGNKVNTEQGCQSGLLTAAIFLMTRSRQPCQTPTGTCWKD